MSDMQRELATAKEEIPEYSIKKNIKNVNETFDRRKVSIG